MKIERGKEDRQPWELLAQIGFFPSNNLFHRVGAFDKVRIPEIYSGRAANMHEGTEGVRSGPDDGVCKAEKCWRGH